MTLPGAPVRAARLSSCLNTPQSVSSLCTLGHESSRMMCNSGTLVRQTNRFGVFPGAVRQRTYKRVYECAKTYGAELEKRTSDTGETHKCRNPSYRENRRLDPAFLFAATSHLPVVDCGQGSKLCGQGIGENITPIAPSPVAAGCSGKIHPRRAAQAQHIL
jgi:hypothetical protein